MNRQEIIDTLVSDEGITRATATKAVDCTLRTIGDALRSGEDVTLRGFATFKVVRTAPRKGRNINTGTPITVPAHKGVKLILSKQLKDAVRQG